MNRPPHHFFSAGVISLAANCHARTVIRRARRERWPRKRSGNMFLFQPPRALRGECAELDQMISHLRTDDSPGYTGGLRRDRISPARRAEAVRLANRIAGVLALARALDTGEGREAALVRVAQAASFKCSARQLRRWFNGFEKGGLAGLVEQKRGRPAANPARQTP